LALINIKEILLYNFAGLIIYLGWD
jgi:hypothetical protein